MRSFQTLKGYYFAAQNQVVATAQSFWKSDTVQAVWQGFTAPIYSFTSTRQFIHSSDHLEGSVQRSAKASAVYLAEVMAAYLIYYRLIKPFLDYAYDEQSDSIVGMGVQGTLMLIKGASWLVTHGLSSLLFGYHVTQDVPLALSTTLTASEAIQHSALSKENFKPCGCGPAQVTQGEGKILLYNAGTRYVLTRLANVVTDMIPGWKGKAIQFGLESFNFGVPLVQYKFSATGSCANHYNAEILSKYKEYAVALGASYTAATWSSSQLLKSIGGAYNPYADYVIYSFLLQMFAVLSISREKPIPWNNQPGYDFAALGEKIIASEPAQYVVNNTIGDVMSAEKLVQTPGMSWYIYLREQDIQNGINSARDKADQLKDMRSGYLYTTVKWMGSFLPHTGIQEKLKMISQTFSQTTARQWLRYFEYLKKIAVDAEVQRGVRREAPMIPNENHFPRTHAVPLPPPPVAPMLDQKELIAMLERLEAKNAAMPPPLPILLPTFPAPPKEDKSEAAEIMDAQKEEKPLVRGPPETLPLVEKGESGGIKPGPIVINTNYFADKPPANPITEPRSGSVTLPNGRGSVANPNTLFNPNKPVERKPIRSESATARQMGSLLSGAGRSRF